jgi:single-strand DNA-binding protein
MASFNSCTFSGRAGNDAESKTFGSGNSVAKFRLAVDRYGKKDEPKPGPLWIAVEVWGKQAQVVSDYVKKGTQIIVSGELSMDEWQKKDGEKQVTPTLRCMNFTLLGGEKPGGSPMAAKRSQPDPQEDEIPF